MRARVRELRRSGFPSTEGYYLVLLSPLEVRELVHRLACRELKATRRYDHPPWGIFKTMKHLGADFACVLGDAVVCSMTHEKTAKGRRSVSPRRV